LIEVERDALAVQEKDGVAVVGEPLPGRRGGQFAPDGRVKVAEEPGQFAVADLAQGVVGFARLPARERAEGSGSR